jgi:aminoglycoside phosphotransferase (APT) family kinase protein
MAEGHAEQLVDEEALRTYLEQHIPGHTGPLLVEKHTAGYSNETFYVTRGDEHWVMRRPPAGPLLPTAHDVLREYRFISALYGKARVAKPIIACEDPSVIGAPFYLMEKKEGHVSRSGVEGTLPPAYDNPEGRRRMADEILDALVEIHAVDWRAEGLTGRDSGYTKRQLDRWSSQWALTRPRTRDLPGLDEITQWLNKNLPADVPHTVVHGDYKLDNVMWDHNEPKVIAVFDWEMATIGDPLADLAWLMYYWEPLPIPERYADKAETLRELTTLEGFPRVPEMVAMYEQKSGRSMQSFLFYHVLAAYKLIVILEGLYMHYLEGSAANPNTKEFEWRVPMMVEQAQALIARGG